MGVALFLETSIWWHMMGSFRSLRHPNSKKRIAWDILAVLVSWSVKSPKKFRYNWTKHPFSGAFAVSFREDNISRKGSDFGMLMRFSQLTQDFQWLPGSSTWPRFFTHKSWPLKRAKKCPPVFWNQMVTMKKKLWLFRGFVGDEILPSYVGIIS